MPSLSNHQSSEFTKLLLIGDSGGGKTGALASLVKAGYNLRVLDLDNGLDILANVLTPEEQARVHFITCTEQVKPVSGRAIITQARAFTKAMNALTSWKDEDADHGKPDTWGPGSVLAIDSLTMLSQYAMNHVLGLNNRLNTQPYQADWGVAQGLVRDILGMLTSDSFKTNVIMNCHITYVGRSVETLSDKGEVVTSEEDVRGYPASLGRALSPTIGRYFNHALMARTQGTGPAAKRHLFTNTQGVVELKAPAPGKVKNSYPIETGLADYFKAVRS